VEYFLKVCYVGNDIWNTKLFMADNLIFILRREMELRNYSQKTIEAYTRVAKDLYRYYKKPIRELSDEDIKVYLSAKQKAGLSSQTIALYANAINFLFSEIYKQKDFQKIRHPKRSKKLPIVLNREELKLLFNQTQNPKHRLLLELAYAAGLRVSEAVRLRARDIDLSEMTLVVRQGKGKKDRLTIISARLLPQIQTMMAGKKPADFLFASERGGHISEATAQKVFYACLRKSGIGKPASFHSLRHSFATHLLENGTDIRYVQELLGHANIRTTQIYTQVTNPKLKMIKSPF